jgi:hypothetical protein
MMFNNFMRYALLPLWVVSFLSSTANASGYCIYDIAAPQPYLLSDDIKNNPLLESGRDGKAILPRSWKKLDGSNRVIAHNDISVFTNESKKYLSNIASVLWQFSPDDKIFKQPELIEPDVYEPHYSPLEDRILFVDERWIEKDGSTTYQPKLYEYDFKSSARLVNSSLANFPSDVHGILWSEGLNGWLLTYKQHKPPYTTVALWTKSALKPLDIFDSVEMSTYLPKIEKVAVLSFSGFHLLNLDGSTALFQHINSGDDYNGWDALYPLQNNWFYVAGAQYDHLFQMIQEGNEWRTGELIRLRPKEGFFLSLLTKLAGFDKTQIKRDTLSSIKYMNLGKLSYSPVLKTMIFGESGKIFKNGKLEKSYSPRKLDWPLGDIEFAGVTAYWGEDKKVHLYDGKKWMVASGPQVQRGRFSIVSSQKRIFYSTFTDGKYSTTPLYELLQKDGRWVIESVNIPEESPPSFTEFYEPLHGNDILVFTRRSIYALNGNSWQAIWKPESGGVNITAHLTPLRLGSETEKQGILFTAGDTFHWLERCE